MMGSDAQTGLHMLKHTIQTLASLVLILCVVAGIVAWRGHFSSLTLGSNGPSTRATLQDLRSSNQSYTSGVAAEKQGDYSTAIEQFQAALTTAKDPQQALGVQVRLADAYASSGRYKDAISVFQDLAQDTRYSAGIRAYVVYRMAALYDTYRDAQITEAIFAAPPFHDLAVKGDTSLSYRHLYEYSTQLSPNAYGDMGVANWYASRAVIAHTNPGSAASSTSEYLAQVHAWLAKSRKDPDWSDSPFWSRLDGLFLSLKNAVVVERLSLAGDTVAGDPETLFKQLLEKAQLYPQRSFEADVRLQFAYFLYLMHGTQRTSDIVTILAPLYSAGRDVTNDHAARVFLANAATKKDIGNRTTIIAIANIDPDFKQYLVSLGWKASDFGTK